MAASWETKVERAREHIETLRLAVDEYATRVRPRVDWRLDVSRSTLRAYLVAPEEPPDRLSAIIGDIVHNLRSALDTRMYRILSDRADRHRSAGCPGAKPDRQRFAFPVVSSRHRLVTGEWHQRLGDRKLFRALERVQPYRHFDVQTPAELKASIRYDPLTVLHDLWNVDKHRTTHTALCGVRVVYVAVPPGGEVDYLAGDPRPHGDGSVIIQAKVTAGDPAQVQGGGEVLVALEHDLAISNPPSAVDRMKHLNQKVEWILDELRGF